MWQNIRAMLLNIRPNCKFISRLQFAHKKRAWVVKPWHWLTPAWLNLGVSWLMTPWHPHDRRYSASHSLRSYRPLKPMHYSWGFLGERHKLPHPQGALGRSSSRQTNETIWCIGLWSQKVHAALVAAVFVDFPENKCAKSCLRVKYNSL